jgi:hypothetical protein
MSREGEGPCGFAGSKKGCTESGGKVVRIGMVVRVTEDYCRAVLMLADAVQEAGRRKKGRRK